MWVVVVEAEVGLVAVDQVEDGDLDGEDPTATTTLRLLLPIISISSTTRLPRPRRRRLLLHQAQQIGDQDSGRA